jgi:carbohydrate kinase (thermoresistant glucokinase family)
MGVSGSGKTTVGRLLANDIGWKHFDADDFHPAANIERMKRGLPLNDADREPWLLRLRGVITSCLERNDRAVLSCSALKESYRSVLTIDERVQLVYLQGSSDLIKQRLSNRSDHYMNPVLLDSQFDTLEEPANSLRIDISAPPGKIVAVIREHFGLETS